MERPAEQTKATGSSYAVPVDKPSERENETPLDALKARLSLWDPILAEENEIRRASTLYSYNGDKTFSKEEAEEQENSPYAEVCAAVPNYDEDVPASTVRAWALGISLAVFGAAVNTLFSLRQPAISIGTIVAQLFAYFLGVAWAKFIPSRQLSLFGLKWNTNPGSFNVKEHTVVVVMANVSLGTAYATDIILAQVTFFKQDFGILFQLLLVITSQSLGYGIAGLLRKVLVYPAAMIWPINVVSATLLHSMHEKHEEPDPKIIGGRMSRYKWFGLVMLGSYLYYFLPGFLAQFLSIFAFATWIAPNSPVVNQLFGGTSGLSILPITFDWTQIAGFVGSPLIPRGMVRLQFSNLPPQQDTDNLYPAIANTALGVVIFFIFTTIGVHYAGLWDSSSCR